jgi:hypothetical protein
MWTVPHSLMNTWRTADTEKFQEVPCPPQKKSYLLVPTKGAPRNRYHFFKYFPIHTLVFEKMRVSCAKHNTFWIKSEEMLFRSQYEQYLFKYFPIYILVFEKMYADDVICSIRGRRSQWIGHLVLGILNFTDNFWVSLAWWQIWTSVLNS